MRRIALVAVVGLVVIALGTVGVHRVVQYHLYTPVWQGPAEDAPEFLLEIERGQGLRTVATLMVEAGLAHNARILEWYGRYHGFQTRLQAGRYQASPGRSPTEILRRIVAGDAVFEEITITIPEGWGVEDIERYLAEVGLFEPRDFRAAALMQEGYRGFEILSDLEDGTLLEGYLFPETYRVFPESTPVSLVRRMIGTLEQRVSRDLRAEIDQQERSLHEILTLASIVQKESAGIEEMPDVAGVFSHRLRIGMRLESDATVNYVLGTSRRQPTFADTEVEHPYNTYRNVGLPPGPIGNPGIEAIRAAVNPSDTEYLFFLHKVDNEIVLSRTFAEHLAAKARYLD